MTNIRFTPSPGFLLIKIKSSDSPIDMVHDEASSPSVKGTIVSIGGNKLHQSGVEVGCNLKVKDVVVFKTYGIDDLKLNDIEYKIVPFENIRGVLK